MVLIVVVVVVVGGAVGLNLFGEKLSLPGVLLRPKGRDLKREDFKGFLEGFMEWRFPWRFHGGFSEVS